MQLAKLQREIDALRLAAKLVKDEVKSPDTLLLPTSPKKGRSELNRERTEKVIQILRDAGGKEVHADDLARVFAVSGETMKEWMHLRIRKYGTQCPWEIGKHSYCFKLRETRPNDLEFPR